MRLMLVMFDFVCHLREHHQTLSLTVSIFLITNNYEGTTILYFWVKGSITKLSLPKNNLKQSCITQPVVQFSSSKKNHDNKNGGDIT